jgi:hypothetical protein
MFAAGYLVLVWNLLALGRKRSPAFVAPMVPAE